MSVEVKDIDLVGEHDPDKSIDRDKRYCELADLKVNLPGEVRCDESVIFI